MDNEERTYFNHLKKLVRFPQSKDYELLLEHLWRKEYYGLIPNDQNREKDGIFLRDVIGPDVDYAIFGPCRVLEMLIALSNRMEFELFGTEFDKSYVSLFWEMINNLGLLDFDNLTVIYDAKELELDHILTDWLDRKYSSDGTGGIFPIKGWKRGVDRRQNNVEIWYQMMLYLSKNYEV